MAEHLNLRYLSYFVATADTGSMTRAAEQLHVSQSAISQAVSELELQLGVDLLVRRRSVGVTPTEAGRRVLVEARILLHDAENLVADAHNFLGSLSGPLTIGCATTMAPFLMPRLLRNFTAEHPAISLTYTEGSREDLQRQLQTGVCEAAILYDIDVMPDFGRTVLTRVQPYVALPADDPLAARETIRLKDLAGRDMVMMDLPESESFVRSLAVSAGFDLRIRYRSSSFEMVRGLVARGFGFSILHQRPASDLSSEGIPLTTRPLAGDVPNIAIVIATPRDQRRSRRLDAFIAHCLRDTPRQELLGS